MVLILMFRRNELFYLERITIVKPFPNIPMTPMTYKNDNDKFLGGISEGNLGKLKHSLEISP